MKFFDIINIRRGSSSGGGDWLIFCEVLLSLYPGWNFQATSIYLFVTVSTRIMK